MPNWVTNKLTFEGKGAKEALASHLGKNEYDEITFDFNTVEKRPEELDIERSSRMTNGLKLAITKRAPACVYYGNEEDKMPSGKFAIMMVNTFGLEISKGIGKYIATEEDIDKMLKVYDSREKWEAMEELGEKALSNLQKYGATDWYDWNYEHWGCKWNACNAFVTEDETTVFFDTPWCTPGPLLLKLSQMHPELTIKHDYAEEQIAFMCGHDEYKGGEMVSENEFEAYSKEAYEMYFELWGCEEEFHYDPQKGTYVENETEEEEMQ